MPFDPHTHESLQALAIPCGGSQDDASPPIDLRQIPRDQWEQYLCHPLLLPPSVATYLTSLETEPTNLEKDNLETAINTHHGITEPYTAILRAGQARLMRE